MLSALLLSLVTAATPARRAVLVGSNAAIEGRTPLHFAHRDAQNLADVLRTSGGFSASDVRVLLDASPDDVLAALALARAEAAADGLLVFYYSGHADEAALYPGGKALPLATLKERLGDANTGVRIGIIDACRGGGWTQAKGLTPTKPFEVGVPALSSEGTALLAASSGLEDAHEAEVLQGSFFTHHLVGGLRGAADSSGDGQVTLSEAFAYANRLTIRDTATRSREPQHPSFDLRLRGRQDVVLTTVPKTGTQLVVAQTQGPLEVVQLSTGITVVEAAPGEQVLRLALVPGPYLVRRVKDGQVFSREVQVKPDTATTLAEADLTLVGTLLLPTKGPSQLRGREAVGVMVSVAPLDTFTVGVAPQVDFTHFFSSAFGWRVLRASYVVSIPRGTRQQLEKDFGVLPTTFVFPEFTASSAVSWEPTLISGSSELRATVSVGGGAVGILSGAGSAGARRELAPSFAFDAGLLFAFARLGSFGALGLKLDVGDQLAVASFGLLHFVTANLGLVVLAGDTR